uniref:Soluble scavenger receptor cysteine-rich domain-containing protein SSC5D n=1 Tax=Latimeria chalumnae TaxID=7897 RepID=H2ZWZ2_LATCH
VRLVNGSHQCAGRVEVYHNGEWGTVCDDGWGLEEAEVVCREIGCGSAVSAPGSAAFGKGTGMIWLDDVVCTPAAPSIFNCMAKTLGNANCGHIEDAGVVCSGKFYLHYNQVRLVNGPNQCSGRVEVYHSGEWGTVCDDDWGMKDAEVVCRQIGCRSAVSAPGSARFGQGTGRIWLDDVACTPAAASIFNCMGTPWGAHNCDHGEDAGVVCSGKFYLHSPLSQHCMGRVLMNDVRLVNGPNQCSGRVEVYHSGEWGTVCDDDWGIEDAQVVCTQIGCGSAVSAPGSARFGQGMGRIWLDDVACTPATASIFNCMVKSWGDHDCGHGEDAGVVCSAHRLVCGPLF